MWLVVEPSPLEGNLGIFHEACNAKAASFPFFVGLSNILELETMNLHLFSAYINQKISLLYHLQVINFPFSLCSCTHGIQLPWTYQENSV